MIFIPYPDEKKVISMIHKYRNEEYALLRMTFTMIDKNNLDANGILRDLLYDWGLVDYENMKNGGKFGETQDAMFIQEGEGRISKIKILSSKQQSR